MSTLKNILSRFRSKVVLLSILPIILLLGDTYGIWNIIHMPKDTFVQVFVSISSILVTLGILNDPSQSERF